MSEKIFNFIFELYDGLLNFFISQVKVIEKILLGLSFLPLLWLFFPGSRNDVGEFSLQLLLIILFSGPIAFLVKSRLLFFLLRFRKQLGIAMGLAALVHVLGFLLDGRWLNYFIIKTWPSSVFDSWHLLIGFIGVLLILPLLITSNTWSVKIMGGNWKKLHRLVYVIFIAAVLHQNIRSNTDILSGILASLPVIIIYIYLKLLVKHPNWLPGLSRAINYVDNKYLAYQQSKKAAAQTI